MKHLWLVLLLSIALNCQAEGYTDEYKIKFSKQRVDQVTDWSVRNLIHAYNENNASIRSEILITKYIGKEYAVSSTIRPSVDKLDVFSGINMTYYYYKAGSFRNKLFLVSSHQYNNKIYDLWISNYMGGGVLYPSEDDETCRFIVTVAEDKKGKREVLYEASKYFDQYKIDETKIIIFGLKDDPVQLSMTTPWMFPNCYDDPELRDYYIRYSKDGSHVREALSWYDHYRRDRNKRWFR